MSNARMFGAGVLFATPASAYATPVEFGVLQEVSVDFNFTSKPLMGQFQMPVAVARGSGKIGGSAKFAELNGPVFQTLFFSNVTPAAGQKLIAYNEADSIPGASTYAITVANAASFDENLGVKYAATGAPLTLVAAAPTVGQYSYVQATGVYTFAAADEGKAVLISYSYTQASSGSGSRFVISNPLMGIAPTFQIDFYQTNPNVSGAQWSLRFYTCMSDKLNFGSKLEDWTIPSFDYQVFTNAANDIGEMNTAV